MKPLLFRLRMARSAALAGLICAVLSAAPPQAHSQDQADEPPECGPSQTTTLDMMVCEIWRYEQADARLNAIYNDLIAVYRRQGSKGSIDALRTAQRAWLSYRDLDCERQAHSGSAWRFERPICLAKRTRQRTALLREERDFLWGTGWGPDDPSEADGLR